jgi:hypothetical protein
MLDLNEVFGAHGLQIMLRSFTRIIEHGSDTQRIALCEEIHKYADCLDNEIVPTKGPAEKVG